VQVREKMLGSNFVDQDFMKGGFPFTVEWKNKFLDAANAIKSFRLYISTYPGGLYLEFFIRNSKLDL
jgi:hypothetical protein